MSADWASRYARAAAEVPVRALARLCGANLDGYWISSSAFFFLDQHIDPRTGLRAEAPAVFDAAAGQARPILDAARRSLIEAEFGAGDLDYDLPGADRLAVGRRGEWRVLDLAEGRWRDDAWREDRAYAYSPNGRFAAFVEGSDLSVSDRRTGESRPLTACGEPDNAVGRAPGNDTSPIANQRRPRPMAIWSADGTWLLTHQIDERGLPEQALIQHAPPGGGPPALHRFKLSAVGDPLPRATLIAIHVESGRTLRLGPFETQAFSPIAQRLVWFSGPARVAFVRADRFSKTFELIDWRLEDGAARTVLREETRDGHLSLHPIFGAPPNVAVSPETEEALWWSERSGWGHLYLYDLASGAPKRAVTAGDWLVREIVDVDWRGRRVLFTAGGMGDGDPGRRKLCAARLDGGAIEIVAEHDGDVAVRTPLDPLAAQARPFRPPVSPPALSPDGSRIALCRTALGGGAETEILRLDRGARASLARVQSEASPPRPVRARAADGATPLFGALFLPPGFDPAARYPLLDLIYPGPQMPLLPRGHATRTEAQARTFAALGFAVLLLDTRHMPLSSRAVHQCGYGEGEWEPQLADHVATIEALCREHAFLDRDRVGIIGVSGGGAAAARAILTYPDVFKAAVSVCGNHDSRLYRSVWMDTYVGPFDLAESGSHANASYASRLEGALMLVTGDMDDNVLPSQTLAFADALIKANKDFELLIAPNAGHMVLISSAYAQRRVWDFCVRALAGGEPPRMFPLRFSDEELAAYGRAIALEQTM